MTRARSSRLVRMASIGRDEVEVSLEKASVLLRLNRSQVKELINLGQLKVHPVVRVVRSIRAGVTVPTPPVLVNADSLRQLRASPTPELTAMRAHRRSAIGGLVAKNVARIDAHERKVADAWERCQLAVSNGTEPPAEALATVQRIGEEVAAAVALKVRASGAGDLQ